MNSISDYKGLILITFIILAILYFSPDLECMLLFSGILVNIITICLNTGALKIATVTSNTKESFSPNNIAKMEHMTDPHEPKFDDLHDTGDLLKDIPDIKEDLTVKKLKMKKLDPPPKYKGAIDYEDASEPIQVAADNIPRISVTHQGANSRRQMAGQYQKRKLLYPAISRELEEEESKRWWGYYDDAVVVPPSDAPY